MKEKILIVSATAFEVQPTLAHFGLQEADLVVHHNFDVLITGVGMTATAFALGKHLEPKKYASVLNVGIAGSFDQQLALGSLVSIKEDYLSELGAQDHDKFLTIDELGFGKNNFHATADIKDLLKVKGITVNTVHGNAKSIAEATSRFDPKTESMEGAAVFYACQQLQVPCAQVRSISNYVEPRNRSNWQIQLAIKNLNDWLISFLNYLS